MTFPLSLAFVSSRNTIFVSQIVFISHENFTLLVRKVTFLVRKITLLTEMAFFLPDLEINRLVFGLFLEEISGNLSEK